MDALGIPPVVDFQGEQVAFAVRGRHQKDPVRDQMKPAQRHLGSPSQPLGGWGAAVSAVDIEIRMEEPHGAAVLRGEAIQLDMHIDGRQPVEVVLQKRRLELLVADFVVVELQRFRQQLGAALLQIILNSAVGA